MTGKVKTTERLSTRLEQVRISALKDMAGGVASEINSPLALILGSCKQIRRLVQGEQDPVFERLQKIEDTVQKISGIVQGLEAFSNGLESDVLRQVETSDLIKQVKAMRSDKLGRARIQFLCSANSSAGVECRPEQIIQCLLNLIDNSFDAVKASEYPWIGVLADVQNDHAIFKVTDSGMGIHDPRVLGRLMEPFFTTKEFGEGSGLGLSVAKGMIDAHEGELWLNRNTKHTEFIFSIPIFGKSKRVSA